MSVAVVDEQNQPVSDARIEAQLQASVVASAATDTTGKIRIELPAAGKYVLTVSKTGYINTRTEIEVKADSGTHELELVLPQNALTQQKVTVQAESPGVVTEDTGTCRSPKLDRAEMFDFSVA